MDRDKLLKALEDAKMSKTELSEAVGITEAMIAHILSGRKQPSLILARDMARALGCKLDELLA